MVDIIHINHFESRRDNKVKPYPITWDLFVEFILSEPLSSNEKSTVPLFNAVQYEDVKNIDVLDSNLVQDLYSFELFTRRRTVNIRNVDLLVLDYDGGLGLDEAKKRFKDFEYVGYTSFSHQLNNNTDKFRLIFRLNKSIPASVVSDDFGNIIKSGIWDELKQSLLEFAGECDPSSTNQNQIYHIPSVHPDNIDNYKSWNNSGKSLDWEKLKRIPNKDKKLYETPDGKSITNIRRSSNKQLHPNDMIETEIGSVRVGDIKTKIEGVLCPFHDDKKGTEFIKHVEETGNTFLYCRKCDKAYFMLREHEPVSLENNIDNKPLLEFSLPQDKKFVDASNRDKVIKQLQDIEKKIMSDRGYTFSNNDKKYKSHIIYSPEGSGKSRLVINLAKNGSKIIFACKSWEQAEQKYEEYLHLGGQLGFNVKIIRSKDAKARKRFCTKLVRGKSRTPYKSGQVNDNKSINKFIDENPNLSPEFIRLSWEFFSADKLTFERLSHPQFNMNDELVDEYENLNENVNIIITSFEQLRIHQSINVHIPSDWIVWFDDPDIVDVIDIEPYKQEEWGDISDSIREREILEINHRQYFKRDHTRSLGYSVRNNKCVYTTTELITKEAITRLLRKRSEEVIIYDKMENVIGGTITILGTNKVWKRYDGIIPLLNRRLNKLGYPTTLIADGLSSKFNHSNNKGRNDLNKTNILVELSIPHPEQIRTFCDALGKDFKKEDNEIRTSLMLDRLHQAIGRNSGYRNEGFQSVVLVDKKIHKSLVKDTRYFIDYKNSVLIDRMSSMGRKDSRLSNTATPMVKEIEFLINNIDSYISDKRKIKYDLEYVVKTIENDSDRIKFVIRLLMSVGSTGQRNTCIKPFCRCFKF